MPEYIVFESLTVSDLRIVLNRHAETGWEYKGDVSVRASSGADAHPAIIMGRETRSDLSTEDPAKTAKERSGSLTPAELKVMDALVMAWERYLDLALFEYDGAADANRQFRDAIHSAQQILGQRALRREHPDFWR